MQEENKSPQAPASNVVNPTSEVPIPPTEIMPVGPETEVKIKSNKKTILLVVGIFLALLLAAGAAYYLISNQKPTEPESTPTPTLVPTIAPVDTGGQTADWKTITSSDFKVSFKRPPSWQYIHNAKVAETKLPYIKAFSATNETAYNTAGCGIHLGGGGSSGPTDKLTREPLKIDGLDFERITWFEGDIPIFMAFSPKSAIDNFELFYAWISKEDRAQCQSDINGILSTFKFTDKKVVEQPEVTIPSADSVVASPLTVKGKVPTGWMFEGVVPVKLLDASKTLIVQTQGKETTPGSWQSGQAVEFEATIEFTTEAETGYLLIEADNPSGLPENAKSYEIPIKF